MDIKDAISCDSADNNADSNNVFAKTDFSTHNIADANAGTSTDNTSVMREKIGINTNNKSLSQSSKVDSVNKNEFGLMNKNGVGRTNVEAKVGLVRANKSSVSGINIEAGKKANVGTVASTNNSVDGNIKITD